MDINDIIASHKRQTGELSAQILILEAERDALKREVESLRASAQADVKSSG